MRQTARKRLASYLQQIYAISERRASRLVRISRKVLHYQAMRPARDAALLARLQELGERYLLYGYLLLHGLLCAEGLSILGSARINYTRLWACRSQPGGEESCCVRAWR